MILSLLFLPFSKCRIPSVQTLNSINDLATKQFQAQQAVFAAVPAQLQSIKISVSAGSISVVQALAVWKQSRRDQGQTNKAAMLSNIPCSTLNVAGDAPGVTALFSIVLHL